MCVVLLSACGDGGGGGGGTTGTPVTSTANSGAGSLRELLTAAKDGEVLKLASGTVSLATPLSVTKSVTLDLGSAVLDTGGKSRVLEVPAGITVTIKGGVLKGGAGGAITVQRLGQKLGAQDLSAQATTQATYGGVLLNRGTLILDGTAVSGGKANLGGGVANLAGATLTITGTTAITGNRADALPAEAKDDNGAGGGMYNEGILKIEGGSVGNNIAEYLGGGLYAVKTGSVTFSGGTFESNVCTFPETKVEGGTSGCLGGAISTFGPLSMSGGTVRGNTSTLGAGGIYVANTTFTLSGGSILNNTATGTINSGGGGILMYKSTLTMTGGTVKGNSARYGGGIDLFTANTAQISGGTIENNTTTADGGGGGINVNTGSTLTLSGGTVQNNTALGAGGGIVANGEATTLTISGAATLKGNTAKDGGGVAVFGAKLNLGGGLIGNNAASRTGGGIVNGGSVTMTGGEISGNSLTGSATEGGGGVRLYSGSIMIASGGSIKNNSAPYGGGVKTDGAFETSPTSEFVLSGASVSGNTTTDNVGGGFFNGGKLTISSGSVTGNTAKTNGGGVFNVKSAVYAQPGGSVTGNAPDNVVTEP